MILDVRISRIWIPDLDLDFFTHPGSRGQKGSGSWIWIRVRNTDLLYLIFLQIFWERRYKELQQQGLNPENHDFQVHIHSCTLVIIPTGIS
jgi:hypothetical protein